MNTVAIDSLGLGFGLIAVIAWMGFVLFVARFCSLNERLSRNQQFTDDHPRERVGISPVAIDTAERQARADRARFRYATRHGKDVA